MKTNNKIVVKNKKTKLLLSLMQYVQTPILMDVFI